MNIEENSSDICQHALDDMKGMLSMRLIFKAHDQHAFNDLKRIFSMILDECSACA